MKKGVTAKASTRLGHYAEKAQKIGHAMHGGFSKTNNGGKKRQKSTSALQKKQRRINIDRSDDFPK